MGGPGEEARGQGLGRVAAIGAVRGRGGNRVWRRLTNIAHQTCFVNMGPQPPAVFARRLQQARIMRGYSLRALEAAIRGAVSHNALAKYERGEMMPGSETLIALGEALGQPVDFFFRPFRVEVSEVRFRRKSKLRLRRQKAIRELAADYAERYREAEEWAGDVRRFVKPLAGRKVSTVAEAEDAAAALRREWNLGRIRSLMSSS